MSQLQIWTGWIQLFLNYPTINVSHNIKPHTFFYFKSPKSLFTLPSPSLSHFPMDFFKSVFSEDPDPPQNDDAPEPNPDPIPDPDSDSIAIWNFGGLIKTIASKSESVIQTYRRDIEEFGSGLKKETSVIREVASRAVMDFPASLDAGTSVAQESLESVGQAIDDIGSSVWKSIAEIITHGANKLFVAAGGGFDSDSDSNSNNGRRLSSSSQVWIWVFWKWIAGFLKMDC